MLALVTLNTIKSDNDDDDADSFLEIPVPKKSNVCGGLDPNSNDDDDDGGGGGDGGGEYLKKVAF